MSQHGLLFSEGRRKGCGWGGGSNKSINSGEGRRRNCGRDVICENNNNNFKMYLIVSLSGMVRVGGGSVSKVFSLQA